MTKTFERDPSELNTTRINEIKEKFELFYEEKTKGIIIRVRAHWHEHGGVWVEHGCKLDAQTLALVRKCCFLSQDE